MIEWLELKSKFQWKRNIQLASTSKCLILFLINLAKYMAVFHFLKSTSNDVTDVYFNIDVTPVKECFWSNDGEGRRFQINRFLHTFLRKTGWSSTSDRNCMSFREWSAAKRAKRHKHFYHEWKITQVFPTTHASTYFFRKSTTFTITNS